MPVGLVGLVSLESSAVNALKPVKSLSKADFDTFMCDNKSNKLQN